MNDTLTTVFFDEDKNVIQELLFAMEDEKA
jgi:hypothetical protein